jgi:proline iminopeptidase
MEAAWKLKGAWPAARFEVVWDAGHASTEPGIVDALVRATSQALTL